MTHSETGVAIIGGGAAGIAAGLRLREASIDCLLIEARPRLGGRAWTITDQSGFALDLGCGWLHSADRNPWARVAEAQGRTIDKTPPPWTRPSLPIGFPRDSSSIERILRPSTYGVCIIVSTDNGRAATLKFSSSGI